jgi:iron complex outermembrane recepter protein
MRLTLRGASSAALIVGLFGGTALAQEITQPPAETAAEAVDTIQTPEPAPAEAGTSDRVVITGTLVRGASEDAPLPVQSFSLADLADQGAPTAAEFLRSLSISSEASGEADSQVLGAAAGFANVNLRGLGASRTLVLLNGKRFASTDGGSGADINTLPMMAVGRIDVLKDGASVTYGAGAVGGVVNYITRSGFEGFEINASKKMFEGSGGEDSIDALWGVKGESSDLMIAASYGKRHRLRSIKRDFSTNDYADSPAIWTTFNSNPSNYYNASNAFGSIRDYTTDSCRAIGGEITNVLNPTITGSNAQDCAVYLPQYFNLIDEEKYLRGYLEYNSDFSNTQEFHVELHYAKTLNPNIQSGPSLPSGGVRAMDTARTSLIGGFQVPYAATRSIRTATVRRARNASVSAP